MVAGGGLMVVSMAGHGHKQACEQAMEEEEGRQAKLGLICLAGPSFPPFVPSLLPLLLPPPRPPIFFLPAGSQLRDAIPCHTLPAWLVTLKSRLSRLHW